MQSLQTLIHVEVLRCRTLLLIEATEILLRVAEVLQMVSCSSRIIGPNHCLGRLGAAECPLFVKDIVLAARPTMIMLVLLSTTIAKTISKTI